MEIYKITLTKIQLSTLKLSLNNEIARLTELNKRIEENGGTGFKNLINDYKETLKYLNEIPF